MGHRAYVLYERPDGLFNAHYSHWGAHDLELVEKITEDTPLGGDNPEPAFVNGLVSVLESGLDDEAEIEGYLTEAPDDTAVQPTPDRVGVDLQSVVDSLGVAIEALYVVSPDFEVTGYHCFHTDAGVLLYDPGRFYDGEPVSLSYDRGYFRALRDVVDDEEAIERFLERVGDSLDKTILGVSPAITGDLIGRFPEAFVKMGGQTRKGYTIGDDTIPEDSYMVATRVKELPSWAVPDGLEVETDTGVWTPESAD